MRSKKSVVVVVVILGLAMLFGAQLEAGKKHPHKAGIWKKLGTRTVNFKTERDTIKVTGARGDFRQIQLTVSRSSVHFKDLKIVFGDGQAQDVSIAKTLAAGASTRVIDLKGGKRVIKKVTFVYNSKGGKPGKAKVVLWGRR